MGQKVNPHGLRVGVIKDWDSRWYARNDKVGDLLVEDYNIRKDLKKRLYSAGIAKIEIERSNARVKINLHCSRPGVVIGKGGQEIEKLRLELEQKLGKAVSLNIVEIRSPDLNAQLVAENIAAQLEKRISFRRAMMLRARGIKTFGPDKKAAIIEGSKAFSKDLMKKYKIPTASYETFSDPAAAITYLETAEAPIVIKADGLALGKGVVIAETIEEARDAVRSMMEDKVFGESGSRVVIEEFLTGPEVSVLAFTDGKTMVPMVSSMDHKRAHDHDEGLNTGGMGTVAPNPYYTDDIAHTCMDTIFLPTMRAMNAEGRTFRGCLYFGLMLTPNGPKVIEYNCRFGDPETQVVLPLLESDLLTVMEATTNGTLDKTDVKFSDGAAACVILASGGYPLAYEKGKEITGLTAGQLNAADVTVYHAGTAIKDGRLVTNGGRVLGVTATANTLPEALKKAYAATESIHFDKLHKRSDIGARALAAMQ